MYITTEYICTIHMYVLYILFIVSNYYKVCRVLCK